MRTLRLVILHELKSTASKRSFWVMTLLFPLLITAISLGPQLLARRSVESELRVASAAAISGSETLGYVDTAGLIRQLPPDLTAEALRPYADEAAARAAVRSGEISGYFLVPADYLRSGSAVLVTPELSLMTADRRSGQLDYVLRYNLAGDANAGEPAQGPDAGGGCDVAGARTFHGRNCTARARWLISPDRCDVYPFLCDHDERQLHAPKRGQGEGEPHR